MEIMVTRYVDKVVRSLLVGLCVVFLAMFAPPAGADAVYKLEEKGSVTYQDRVPDSGQDQGHSVLNNQGVTLKKVLSREKRLEAKKRERERELARIRDRALLATFTTEEDLIRARDDRVGMIDGLISRLDDRIRILTERLAVVEKRVEMQEESLGDGKAQVALYDEKQRIQRNIENAWLLIDARAEERQELDDQFNDDLIRYRELKSKRS
ncbi:MAG: hypothetical protein KTR32_02660 [Granulosicoccus sp.]|nr:hypothetical protein [Granulosicoccus sp.]